jgi:hypothetical protein
MLESHARRTSWTFTFDNPRVPIFIDPLYGFGSFYDGTFNRVSLDSGVRVGARFLRPSASCATTSTFPASALDNPEWRP